MATLDIDAGGFLAAFDRVCAAIEVDVTLSVAETMQAVHRDGFAITPVRSGRLRRGWYHRTRAAGRQVIGEVGVRGVGYAAVVEYGSQPHLIEPVHASVLRWQGPGGPRFARVVHHPGTAPRAFFRAAWGRAPGHFSRRVRARLR